MRALLMMILSGALLAACSEPPPAPQTEQRVEGGVGWRAHRIETDRTLTCLDRAMEAAVEAATQEKAEGDSGLVGRLREATHLRAVLSREIHNARALRGAQADENRQRIDGLINDIQVLIGASSCA